MSSSSSCDITTQQKIAMMHSSHNSSCGFYENAPDKCRCQRFLFAKLKDTEIVSRLQMLATKENLEVDVSALSLIASRADGSLRDAESILDQLSILDKKVSLAIVQELVSLCSFFPLGFENTVRCE